MDHRGLSQGYHDVCLGEAVKANDREARTLETRLLVFLLAS